MFSAPTSQVSQPKVCLICDRPAIGYHYGVASCKGCKTFFRRMCTLPSEKTDIECIVGNEECFKDSPETSETPVPKVLRCRACRYQKCVDVGMNPLALELKDKESKAPNYQNLKKKLEETQDDAPAQKQVIRALATPENKMQKLVDSLKYLEQKIEAFRASAYNPNWQEVKGLEFLITASSRISMATKMGLMPNWPLNLQQELHDPGEDDFWRTADKCIPKFHPNAKMWIFYDLMTTVEYAKTFEFFHKLEMEDRMILLRHVSLAVMNLHTSYFSVKEKFEHVVNPDASQLPFKDGKFGYAWNCAVSPLIRYQLTSIEYILLKSVCFCNPAVQNLSLHAQNIISEERDLCASALFDHCRRTRSDGVSRYAELISIVGLLERQQKLQKDLHMIHVAPFVGNMPESSRNPLIDDIMNF